MAGTRYGGLRLLAGAWLVPCLLAFQRLRSAQLSASLLVSALVSAWGFYATKRLIPVVARSTERRGLFGYDINKKGTAAGEKKVREPFPVCPATPWAT